MFWEFSFDRSIFCINLLSDCIEFMFDNLTARSKHLFKFLFYLLWDIVWFNSLILFDKLSDRWVWVFEFIFKASDSISAYELFFYEFNICFKFRPTFKCSKLKSIVFFIISFSFYLCFLSFLKNWYDLFTFVSCILFLFS